MNAVRLVVVFLFLFSQHLVGWLDLQSPIFQLGGGQRAPYFATTGKSVALDAFESCPGLQLSEF